MNSTATNQTAALPVNPRPAWVIDYGGCYLPVNIYEERGGTLWYVANFANLIDAHDCLRAVNEHARLAAQVDQLRAALEDAEAQFVSILNEPRFSAPYRASVKASHDKTRAALAATEAGAGAHVFRADFGARGADMDFSHPTRRTHGGRRAAFDAVAVRKCFLADAEQSALRALQTRPSAKRDRFTEEAKDLLTQAGEFSAIFGLKFPPVDAESFLARLAPMAARLKKESVKATRERIARAKANAEKFAAEKKEREEKQAAFAPRAREINAARLALWREGKEPSAEQFEAWDAEHRAALSFMPQAVAADDPHAEAAALRLSADGSRVETSRGAQVLARTVCFLWPFVAKARATASAVAAETVARFPRLDHYNARSIDAHGNLSAGCHFIPFAEIERIARALNLPPFTLAEAEQCTPQIPVDAEAVAERMESFATPEQ